MKQRRILFVLIALLCLLIACQREPTLTYDGQLLTPEQLESMAKIFETESMAESGSEPEKESETETETETQTETETDEPADGIVFWTDGGVVWHEWKTCHRLSDKTPAKTGSIDEAIAAGKERPCSNCCRS